MIGLVRIRAELPAKDDRRGRQDPSFRQFDVPPHMAEQIASWYRSSGWKVETEEI